MSCYCVLRCGDEFLIGVEKAGGAYVRLVYINSGSSSSSSTCSSCSSSRDPEISSGCSLALWYCLSLGNCYASPVTIQKFMRNQTCLVFARGFAVRVLFGQMHNKLSVSYSRGSLQPDTRIISKGLSKFERRRKIVVALDEFITNLLATSFNTTYTGLDLSESDRFKLPLISDIH